jgi:ubiquitin carboxyl-terminal hydrolase 8
LNTRNPLGSGGNVAQAYASLLKKMWSGDFSILAPRALKQTVAAFAPQFDNCYQHDSHEFCQFLMDGLHEDLNRVKTKPYVEELEGRGMKDEIAAVESWRKHLLRHDSIVVDHCQGMHRNHLTCPRCGRESIKFDVYSSISVPLVQNKQRSVIRLEDCLEKFMEGEQLDERNAWYCPKCRQHVCALKMIALWTAPDVLIIHLKRFTFDHCMPSGMIRYKMDDTVEFPIERLDLTDHILGPVDKNAPPIYKLFGVSEHVGPTANSGHYTATVRNSIDNQWYRYNDSHVGRTSGEASILGGAYLLVYVRAKGVIRWGGMENVMKEMKIDPYSGLETDVEGFQQVRTKKKKKGEDSSRASRTSRDSSRTARSKSSKTSKASWND